MAKKNSRKQQRRTTKKTFGASVVAKGEASQGLVPPVGHSLRSEALKFLGLGKAATDAQVLAAVRRLLRVARDGVTPVDGRGRRLRPGREWTPDPRFDEYAERFMEPLMRTAPRERAYVDPVPYLRKLLDRDDLPKEMAAEVRRGLKDRAHGLRLLVEDPRFDGILADPSVLLGGALTDPGMLRVLGPTIRIREERVVRAVPVVKNGRLVARHLSKPVRRTEFGHCQVEALAATVGT